MRRKLFLNDSNPSRETYYLSRNASQKFDGTASREYPARWRKFFCIDYNKSWLESLCASRISPGKGAVSTSQGTFFGVSSFPSDFGSGSLSRARARSLGEPSHFRPLDPFARMTCKEWNPQEHLGPRQPWQRITISARPAGQRPKIVRRVAGKRSDREIVGAIKGGSTRRSRAHDFPYRGKGRGTSPRQTRSSGRDMSR